MATSGLYGSSPSGATVAAPGSESAGLYGNSTTFGGSYFEWFIFIQSDTQPATPTGGSWSFTTNSGTPPTGWSVVPPSAPTLPIWVSIALVNSKNSATLTWSAPGLFAYSSGLPILSGSGEPNPGDGLTDQLYIQTGTTPETIWFKQAGTWTRLTGSTLYADLTSNQTIAGTKTFSSQIQGSISGTASNVTGIVGITNGGTGSTTAAGARTALGVTATGQDTTYAYRANNLSDLASASSARTNLGLGTSAVLDAGVANGVATLDSGGTVPLSQIPASIQGGVSYQGTWNASTNTPTLTSSVGTKGYYYVVSVAGSTNLNGITDWQIGDWAIYSGTAWQKIDNTDAVTSVNGYTGTVVLNAADVGALSNVTSTDGSVTITSPTSTTRDLSVATAASTTNVLCQVRNATGATLTKGTVVYISGATGQLPTVSKAIATGDSTSAQTLGMMTADLANNSNGYVTVIGLITNIDTSAYTDGAQLYLSGTTAGAVTATKPSAPIHLVYIAVVEYAHPTQGKLFVKVQNGYELDEIHDVSIVSPVTGQTLVYNATTDLWENNTVSLTAGVNGTLPVANGGTGQTTANAAFNALAPSQTGNSGKYLTTDGTNTSWAVNAGGDVVGPASSTNNGIALFDGTTGKLLKDSASTDGLIYGITVGRGAGAVATNTAVGASALAANTTGYNNAAFGQTALTTNTTGYQNTAVGRQALYTNADGINNTGVGMNALVSNTSGSYNTGIGQAALQSNTTASYNTAVGFQSGYSNTTGVNNNFSGFQSGFWNTTGSQNTAFGVSSYASATTTATGSNNSSFGYQALYSNTTASSNTAVGYQAGYSQTTGSNNTMLGVATGYSSNGGANNTFVGHASGYYSTTGVDNVAVGFGSFAYNGGAATGSYNVALGRDALSFNTTASYNTVVGYRAGYNNSTGSSGTFVGYQTGYSNTTASYNTAVGDRALFLNTTGIGLVAMGEAALYANTGSNNTALGYQSLQNNTTASYNTAVGYQAGYANTTGQYLAAHGYGALISNTTGSYNTAFGAYSLLSNTSASENTAVGYQSLYLNTTGTYNDASGAYSLYSNTTGNYLTASGWKALFLNTTGSYNTAFGNSALFSNTTGFYNTAVGYRASYSNTTGASNTIIGNDALYYNTTGGNNVAIGVSALQSNTTASSNTAVGYQAGFSNTTGSELTAVGYFALYNNTTGPSNTAVGLDALFANSTGGGNTAIGVAANKLNTTGSANSSLGVYALLQNTTGGANTALGYGTLFSQTTASNNTAVGYQAGYNNTTGTQLVAVGVQALQYNTTGSVNTALGDYALRNSTTGNYNVGSGSEALYKNTTGSYNTANGAFALHENTTASNNTAVGYQAGYSGTTAAYNTVLGYQAGYSKTTGYSNVNIGAGSGYSGTTHVANTFVGNNSGYFATTGSSNAFFGESAGYYVTTGSKNTIVGGYNGNQGGLDIRTANNYIVLSDGDGNPRGVFDSSGNLSVRSGNITQGGSFHGFSSNMGTIAVYTGYAPLNSTFSITVNVGVGDATALISASFAHYSLITNYGCAKMQYVGTGSGGGDALSPIQNSTSANGGSWTFSPGTSTITITHNAGSYNGFGYYTIVVFGNYLS